VAGLAVLSACAPAYLHSQVTPHASLSAHARIAVLPVTAAVSSHGAELSQGDQVAPGAAAIVTRELYEALAQQTAFDVVGRPMVEQALAASAEPPSTPAALQALAGKLGAEAVLQGTVTLFREREGSHVSVSRPAAVGLELWLTSGRDGRLLWSGRYHEVQRSLSEELRTLPLFWKRGTRWLTAEELAVYAVSELIKTLPPVQQNVE
jgi:hypothetical protein